MLTSVLHYKDGTAALTVNDIKEVFERNIQDLDFPDIELSKCLLDFILETADSCVDANEGINLENKIVLSIAIRLVAEKFMVSQITDGSEIGANQTWELLKRYEEEYNNEHDNIEILKRVNLITPANIHINSFMYEPILDMGDGELRQLYGKVKEGLK
ncbi:MAG: hypothetical protein H6750_15615 [Nitrospiraceae bacterium]|nr:hypothetical protein [Nitrospiraceae bacterium]